jgi:hypothetical protein
MSDALDLAAIRAALARLEALAEEHPSLTTPARGGALSHWLAEQDASDGVHVADDTVADES